MGDSKDKPVKVDMFYSDPFIRPIVDIDSIRMASIDEIAAMKIEVIGHSGRKKDFWDIHELLDILNLEQIIDLYIERFPYSYSREEIINKLVDFNLADNHFAPICLKGKYWELIREDIKDAVNKLTL
jgi:hypothetical protein